ncbi:MAG: hypothetical protein GF355_11805, partial [Candidatus Eisenbacteria bacterium]|nr:hypothetical protein [Candidatus Eisenbacteria bacterium]
MAGAGQDNRRDSGGPRAASADPGLGGVPGRTDGGDVGTVVESAASVQPGQDQRASAEAVRLQHREGAGDGGLQSQVEDRGGSAADAGLVSRLRLALESRLAGRGRRGYTPMDLVTLTYLAVTTLFLLAAPHHPPGWGRHVLVHLAALALVASLKRIPQSSAFPFRFLRDWYALIAIPFFYGELDFLNQIVADGYYDAILIPVESWLFRTQPAIFLRSWLPSLMLSEYLHLSYLLYILLIPFCGLTLYIMRRYEAFRVYATTELLTFFLCYLAFILFPVAGPYYAFPRPDPKVVGALFPELVHWMLDRGSSQGAAFPSSHVAVAISSFVVMRRLHRKLSWIILPVVIGITVGVV